MTAPSKTDPNGPKPTVSQAKAAWQAHEKPSLNNVLKALHDAGFTGTVRSTLNRWQKSGWADQHRTGGPLRSPPQPAAAIKEVTDKVAADELTAAEKAIAVIEAEITELKKLAAPPATLDEAKRIETLIADIILARRIQRYAGDLVFSKEGAKVLEALKGAANVAEAPANTVVEPKTVGGNIIEHDATERPATPLQRAIHEFRSQQLKVVQ